MRSKLVMKSEICSLMVIQTPAWGISDAGIGYCRLVISCFGTYENGFKTNPHTGNIKKQKNSMKAKYTAGHGQGIFVVRGSRSMLPTTFSDDVFEIFFIVFLILIAPKFVPLGPVHSKSAFDMRNGLVPNMRQTITGTNDNTEFAYAYMCQYRPRWVNIWGRDKMVVILQPTFSSAFFLFNESHPILIQNSLKLITKGPALVQMMAWCRTGDKPSSGPMVA